MNMKSPSVGSEILKKWDTQRSTLSVTSKASLASDAPEDLVRIELEDDDSILRLVSLSGGSDRRLDLPDVKLSPIVSDSRIALELTFADGKILGLVQELREGK